MRTAGSSHSPGRTTLTSRSPRVAATAVVARKKRSVLPPIRPTRERSPSCATPSASEAKTRGTTTMKSIRRKTCPTGSATLETIQSSVPLSPQRRLAPPPSTAPTTSPIRMRVWSCIPRGRADGIGFMRMCGGGPSRR